MAPIAPTVRPGGAPRRGLEEPGQRRAVEQLELIGPPRPGGEQGRHDQAHPTGDSTDIGIVPSLRTADRPLAPVRLCPTAPRAKAPGGPSVCVPDRSSANSKIVI